MSNRWVAFRTALSMPEQYKMYSWKHTGNIRALKTGISKQQLQGQNGHTTIQTTEIYTRGLVGQINDEIINSFPCI